MATTSAIPLSLDSMFYNQLSCHGSNDPNNENHVQENISKQQLPYYSSLRNNHDVILEGSKQQLPCIAEDEVACLKSWFSRDFPACQAQESRMFVPLEDNGSKSGPNIGSITYEDLHSLNLSVSPTRRSSCVTGSPAINDTKKRGLEMVDQNQKKIVHRKSIDTFGQRTSQYRGVTRSVLLSSFLNHISTSGTFILNDKAVMIFANLLNNFLLLLCSLFKKLRFLSGFMQEQCQQHI